MVVDYGPLAWGTKQPFIYKQALTLVLSSFPNTHVFFILDRALLFCQPGMHTSMALPFTLKSMLKAKEEL
jgi:hypothetical protein